MSFMNSRGQKAIRRADRKLQKNKMEMLLPVLNALAADQARLEQAIDEAGVKLLGEVTAARDEVAEVAA